MPEATSPDLKREIVSSLLNFSMSSYEWGKVLAIAQLPAAEAPLAYLEGKLAETTAEVLKRAKTDSETVVKTLDSTAFDVIEYLKVDEKLEDAKKVAALRVQQLKGDEAKELAEEIELQQLIADAREVAWERVAGLQTTASNKVDEAIAGVEGYVDAVLPAEEGEEEPAAPEEEQEEGTKVARVRTLSATVSRRFKKKAMASLKTVELKLRESPIVHVDLVRYAELLELEAVRARVSSTAEQISQTDSYAVVKGYVVKASDITEKYKAEAATTLEAKVVAPSREFYAVATAMFIQRVKSAEDLLKMGQTEYETRSEFAAKYLASVKAAVGDAWEQKLQKPLEGYLEVLRACYKEGRESAAAAAPDGTPYTISSGLSAFVTALNARLAHEWEARVQPTIDAVKARTAMGKAAEKEEVFVDASE